MPNWIEHVKKYAKDNNVPYRDALKLSAESYKSSKDSDTKEKVPEVPKVKKTKSVKKPVEKPVEIAVESVPIEPKKKSRCKKATCKC